MKRILVLLVCLCIGIGTSYAYVIICPFEDDNSGARDGCLRVTRIKQDGQWIEATCDNVDPPSGWFKHNCE